MKRQGGAVRIVAIILVALMVLSAAAVALTVFSGGASAAQVSVSTTPIPNTGFADDWMLYLLGGAVLLAIGCVVLPRVLKKKLPQELDDDDDF
ncbi:MAG: LPXTG cell wall anchor domain-containing protein [Oscillospiraceae bacterium]|jgi:LPXTG-motif cell wall-anchored protein|nr:LPXTG cell wall anchor domain-containing protein [Oscillospiraceae bacterium]